MDHVDTVVIGAGVVGLAVARALATAGREVVILEAEDAIGKHTSSRNSEVIHAGIYYPRDSLKARTCVESRQRLYDYCDERRVPYRRCGKLIVATDAAQLEELEGIRRKAHANAVTDVVPVSPRRLWRWNRSCIASRHCLALNGDHRQPRADARVSRRRGTRRCNARVEEPAHGGGWSAPTASSCTSWAPSRSLPLRW